MSTAEQSRTVFVAGATGVVGLPAVRALVADGHKVTGVARTEAKADELRALGATSVSVDLFESAGVLAATAGHDVIVNLVTKIPPTSKAWRAGAWDENERIRREVSAHLADAAIAHGAARMIQEALGFAYADGGNELITEEQPIQPEGPFTAVLEAEANTARVTAAGAVGVVLRFGNFYGPTAGHTLDIARLAKRRMSSSLGELDAYWPIIHTDDAGAAVAAAMRAPAGVYNVVDDEPLTRAEIDAAIAVALGVKALRRPPGPVLHFAEKRAPLLDRSVRVSNAKLKAATGWAPVYPSAREGWAAIAASFSTQ